tara:strand:- start:381 stop:1400 length:1020 start_codon:yes stop_codon:yes gene_type:complete
MTTQPFEFGDAIGHFFKTMGRRPGGTLWVALWNSILISVVFGAVIWMVAPAYLSVLDTAMTGEEPDASEVWAIMGPFLFVFPLAFFGSIIAALVAQGAWLRLLVRDEIAAGIPLRFGGDELRLLVVNLLYMVLGIAFYIAFVVLVIVMGIAFAGSDGGLAAGATAALIGGTFVLLALVIAVFLGVRLSAAPALTVYDRKIRFFESWGATSRIFWWLLLTYLVMAVIIFAAQSILGTMIQVIFLGAFFPMFMEMSQVSDAGAMEPHVWIDMLRDYLSDPATLGIFAVGIVLSVFLQTFCEALWHSVGAYTAIRHRTPPAEAPAASPVVTTPPAPEGPAPE